LLTVSVCAWVGAASSAFAAGGSFPGAANATVGPLIAGTSSVVHGTYAWTGYPYNDTSAYPRGVAANSANLIQLQLGLTAAGDLRIGGILETLTDPSAPQLVVGFNTDANSGTGAATLPGWIADGALGLDALVVIDSTGATVERWDGTGWVKVGTYDAEIDPTSNSMVAVIPRAALNAVGQTWQAVAALGLSGADSFLTGKGLIYNLGFVHEEPCVDAALAQCDPAAVAAGTGWQDGESKLILTGKAPVSAAEATIDFGALARGRTQVASADVPGFHTLLYYSHLNIGEGWQPAQCIANADPCSIYAGPFQPYAVEVPEHPSSSLPAMFLLHGVTANHLWRALPGNGSPPGVLVFPLGRGPDVGFGGGDATSGTPDPVGAYGEQDVLDVYADVVRRLPLDRDRIVVAGVSLGGLGAFHIAEFHPDLFSGVFSEVGGDCCIASTNHAQPRRLENLINMPVRLVNGMLDPLSNAPAVLTDLYPALDALGDVDYLGFELTRRSHDIGTSSPNGLPDVLGNFLPVEQCLMDELLARKRTQNPARVVYVVDPNFEFAVPSTGLSELHTGACWVSGLHPRGSEEGRIDVTALTRPVQTSTGTAVNGAGQNVTQTGDLCGANPNVRTDDTWTVHGVSVAPGTPTATGNGFHATITQFATATLDLPQMGISVRKPITAVIGGDGQTRLTLRGPWADGERVSVTRDGVPDGTVVAEGGDLVLNRDLAWQTNVGGSGVDLSGVAPPAYLHTPAGDISVDQEPQGRVLGTHTYVLKPQGI
jgi:pimeloyl-ACP methyl ester carboxylesterase